jgi:hypothetical protein
VHSAFPACTQDESAASEAVCRNEELSAALVPGSRLTSMLVHWLCVFTGKTAQAEAEFLL